MLVGQKLKIMTKKIYFFRLSLALEVIEEIEKVLPYPLKRGNSPFVGFFLSKGWIICRIIHLILCSIFDEKEKTDDPVRHLPGKITKGDATRNLDQSNARTQYPPYIFIDPVSVCTEIRRERERELTRWWWSPKIRSFHCSSSPGLESSVERASWACTETLHIDIYLMLLHKVNDLGPCTSSSEREPCKQKLQLLVLGGGPLAGRWNHSTIRRGAAYLILIKWLKKI